MKSATKPFAICIDDTDYKASLIRGKVYQILPDPTCERHIIGRDGVPVGRRGVQGPHPENRRPPGGQKPMQKIDRGLVLHLNLEESVRPGPEQA